MVNPFTLLQLVCLTRPILNCLLLVYEHYSLNQPNKGIWAPRCQVQPCSFEHVGSISMPAADVTK